MKESIETIELQGIIDFQDHDGRRLFLHDGHNDIDVVSVFEDIVGQVQLNYWICDNPCTKDELLENWLKKVCGYVDAENESVYTGSWTYGSQSSWGEYETRGSITIGGHDLFNELSEQDGKFIIMEINLNTPPC